MYLRQISIFIIALSIIWACDSDSNVEQENMENTSAQEDNQNPGTTLPQPDNNSPQTQAGEISDKELKQFGSVARYAQLITQQAQQKMMGIVQQSGLELQRFNEMIQAEQNPNKEIEATAGELEKYEAITGEFKQIQMQAQSQMQDKIQAEGLSESRYRKISMALRNNPELQERFRTLQEQAN